MLFNCPADDGAVVRALARDGQHLARLPAGTAEVAVIGVKRSISKRPRR
jgi:hypothetical protein